MKFLDKILNKKEEEAQKKADLKKAAKVRDDKKENLKNKDDKKIVKDIKKDTKVVKTDEKNTEEKDEVKKEVKKIKNGNAYKILVKPLITEKAGDLGKLNKYLFEVSKDANKIEVSKAIEEVYSVRPKSINIIRVKGKTVRRGKIKGKRKDWKKAIVTLSKEQSINIYEGV